MAEPMVGERKIASSHPLLMSGGLVLAAACFLVPVWMVFHVRWGWLELAEKAGFVLYAFLMVGVSGILFRLAVVVGLYASEEGLRVQRLFRSETILWREIGGITTHAPERWVVLQRGAWGDLVAAEDGASSLQRTFVAEKGVGVSTAFSAQGLRELAKLLLQRVPPETWLSDPEARQWLVDQAEGTGPFLSRLI